MDSIVIFCLIMYFFIACLGCLLIWLSQKVFSRINQLEKHIKWLERDKSLVIEACKQMVDDNEGIVTAQHERLVELEQKIEERERLVELEQKIKEREK